MILSAHNQMGSPLQMVIVSLGSTRYGT